MELQAQRPRDTCEQSLLVGEITVKKRGVVTVKLLRQTGLRVRNTMLTQWVLL